MESGHVNVALGKQLTENAYNRRPKKWKELDLGHIKIDHFDPSTRTVHEIKKTPRLEKAHVAQVKYYLAEMEKLGIPDVKGLIEYPKQRKTTSVSLGADDRERVKDWIEQVEEIVSREACPTLVPKSYCKSCAYYDFCYS